MRFSVIVPAYNAQWCLEECLASIDGQTYRDYEVIVVDDGSTDSTGRLLDELVEKMDKLIVLHGQNRGLLLARRRGLLKAKGDYVVFVDSDDTLRTDALERISQAIDETAADIVSFNLSRLADFSIADKSVYFKPGCYEGGKYALVKEHVCRGRFNNLSGKAIKRCRIDIEKDYSAFGGLMHGEDLLQLLPIVDACDSLVHLPDILYYYRPSDKSSTSHYRPSQLTDIVRVNRRFRQYANLWDGSCPSIEAVGEANQYFSLVKMNEISSLDERERIYNFQSIRESMTSEGVFERLRDAKMRPDLRALYLCLEYGWHGGARAVANLVEMIKALKRQRYVGA